MVSEEELAEIVFKGIGKKISDYEILLNGEVLEKYDIKEFIFSWPDPCAFGLVVDAAEKLGWLWDFSGGWFSFYTWGRGLVEGHTTTQYEWQRDHPMWAVCLAFKEVLEKEGEL